MTRILYGLDRLPRTIPPNDPRLPSLELGPAPLRLNSHPVPRAILTEAGPDHPARIAAMTAWLQAQCGQYDVPARRAIAAYMDAIAATLTRHRSSLEQTLARYDGLYTPEDWTWSALRPLPRAWTQRDGVWISLGMVCWTGQEFAPLPDQPGVGPSPDQKLPSSPFRRQPEWHLGRQLSIICGDDPCGQS